jgi:hypothetical protein
MYFTVDDVTMLLGGAGFSRISPGHNPHDLCLLIAQK